MRKNILLSLLLAVSIGTYAQTTVCKALLEKGEGLFHNKNYEKAKEHFEQAKKQNCPDAQKWIDDCNKKIKEKDKTPRPNQTLTPPNATYSSENTTYIIEIKNSAANNTPIQIDVNNDNWEIRNLSNKWFTLEKGWQVIYVTCPKNEGISEQIGAFEIWKKNGNATNQTKFKIIQQGASTTLKVGNPREFMPNGGKQIIQVQTNNPDDLTFTMNDTIWCHVIKNRTSFDIVCDINNKSRSRTCYLYITTGDKTETITIKQTGVSLEIIRPKNKKLSFSKKGGSENITISTNFIDGLKIDTTYLGKDFSWKRKEYDTLITITITAAENSTFKKRSGKIIIKAGNNTEEIDILQEAEPIELLIRPDVILFDGKGKIDGKGKTEKSSIIVVTTNAEWKVISRIPPWCKVETSTNSITVSVDKSDFKNDRTDTITLQAGDHEEHVERNITISQSKREHLMRTKGKRYLWGGSAGFATKYLNYLDDNSKWGMFEEGNTIKGFSIGSRIDFDFIPHLFGLGLHAAIYYTYYRTKSPILKDAFNKEMFYVYEEHTATIPIHLNYRVNFGKKGNFGLFVHGGANCVASWRGNISTPNSNYKESINDYYKWYDFAIGYGAGINICNMVLAEFSGYSGILNHAKNNDYKIKQKSYLTLTVSFIFSNFFSKKKDNAKKNVF